MADLISEEITGAAVTVSIAGRESVVSYPLHNILLFKKQTGLSLFVADSWDKLDFEEDSEAWTACLWAGLHVRQEDGSWTAPFTLEQLNRPGVIGLQNAVSVHNAMFRALTNWMPRKKKGTEADASADEDLAEKKILTATATGTSPDSGSALNADSGSAETSS
jgi:hypothetical protein